MKKCMMIVMALMAFVANPLVLSTGCGTCGDGYDYSYNAADMARELQVVPTTQTVELRDGVIMEVNFSIDMQSLRDSVEDQLEYQVFRQQLVGDWIQTAQACSIGPPQRGVYFDAMVDVIKIDVSGEREAVATSRSVRGTYVVSSTRLERGFVSLHGSSQDDVEGRDVLAEYIMPENGKGSQAKLVTLKMRSEGISYVSEDSSGFDDVRDLPDMSNVD